MRSQECRVYSQQIQNGGLKNQTYDGCRGLIMGLQDFGVFPVGKIVISNKMISVAQYFSNLSPTYKYLYEDKI